MNLQYSAKLQSMGLEAKAAYDSGDFNLALEKSIQILSEDDNNIVGLTAYSTSLAKLGRFNEAIEGLTRLIRRQPKTASMYVGRAKCHFHAKNYRAAFKDFATAIKYDAGTTSLIERAEYYLYASKARLAKRDLQRVIDIDPTVAAAHKMKADINYGLDLYAEALVDYTNAIELGLKQTDTYVSRGCLFSRERRFAEAYADFSNALELNPNDAHAWYFRGYVLLEMGCTESAIRNALESIRIDPTRSAAYNIVGSAYHAEEHYELAIESFTSSVACLSDSPLARCLRGRSYVRFGEIDKALDDLSLAIFFDSGYVWSYVLRAEAFCELKNFERAVEDASYALYLNPSDANAYFWRHSAYEGLGKAREAAEDLNRYYELS